MSDPITISPEARKRIVNSYSDGEVEYEDGTKELLELDHEGPFRKLTGERPAADGTMSVLAVPQAISPEAREAAKKEYIADGWKPMGTHVQFAITSALAAQSAEVAELNRKLEEEHERCTALTCARLNMHAEKDAVTKDRDSLRAQLTAATQRAEKAEAELAEAKAEVAGLTELARRSAYLLTGCGTNLAASEAAQVKLKEAAKSVARYLCTTGDSDQWVMLSAQMPANVFFRLEEALTLSPCGALQDFARETYESAWKNGHSWSPEIPDCHWLDGWEVFHEANFGAKANRQLGVAK